MSLKNKLNRMKKHLNIEHQQEQVSGIGEARSNHSNIIPKLGEWADYGARPFYFQNEYCFIREVEYSLDYQHGLYRLGELHSIMKNWTISDLNHPLSGKNHQASDLFFFDTETTGLSGGAGTTIFLLGYARVMEEKVIVRQHLLPGPGHEIALYQSFLQEVDYTTLVTYNGKAFDWPQVKTRHTLIRDHVPKLPAFGHFDLLHAARRLWKEQLESVRLANVEKEVLGIKRENDIPGYLAPMIYFDFVKSNELQGMKGVLKHNEWDVLTLITLYIHLSKLLQLDDNTRNRKEEYEIGRWLDSIGEKEAAAALYENLVENSWQASFKLGLIKKKQKEFIQAKELFMQAFHHHENTHKEMAGIELSKLLEHQEKDYQLALYYAETSYVFWKEKQPNRNLDDGNANSFHKRIARLQRKVKK